MLFAIMMHDRPDGAEIRVATSDDHIRWIGENHDHMYVGGPLLDDDGRTIGSLIITECADRAAAAAYIADEPYNRAGLFESVVIRGFDARVERGAGAPPFEPGHHDG